MPFGNLDQRVTGLLQELPRQLIELLPMAERTGRVVGDLEASPHHGRIEFDLVEELSGVAGQARHILSPFRVAMVSREEIAVVLQHGPTAAGRRDHRIQKPLAHHAGQRVDIAPSVAARFLLTSEMVRQRAAAAFVLDHHHIHAVTAKQTNRGLVDLRRQDLLNAAQHDRHALGLRRPGIVGGFGPQDFQLQRVFGNELKRRRDPLHAQLTDQVAERPCKPAEHQHGLEPAGIGQHPAQEHPHRVLVRAAVTALLDAHAGEIDQMHIVDAARTGRHAAEAGQTAVDVMHRGRRHVASLEHLLHEIDAPARTVPLIPCQHIGGTGGRAQPAMNAAAQDLVGTRDRRVPEL